MNETVVLTGDVELGDGGGDALVVLSVAHQLAAVVGEHLAQRQDARAVFEVVDAKLFGRYQLFAIQVPGDHGFRERVNFHLKPILQETFQLTLDEEHLN